MTTIISDAGVQFAGGNIVDIRSAVPTTGSYTQGDVVIEKSTNSELAGWKRLTTGSDHVLGTDWLYFGAMGVGQTWQNVTGSRTSGTTYYNTTGKPIVAACVLIGGASSASSAVGYVDGLMVAHNYSIAPNAGFGSGASVNIVVPTSSSYRLDLGGGGTNTWLELR